MVLEKPAPGGAEARGARKTRIHPSAWKESSRKFVNDSSPVASVSALCNTAARLRVVSPLYASRNEEDGEDQPFGALAAAGGMLRASDRGVANKRAPPPFLVGGL
jgi:hypothetical protein